MGWTALWVGIPMLMMLLMTDSALGLPRDRQGHKPGHESNRPPKPDKEHGNNGHGGDQYGNSKADDPPSFVNVHGTKVPHTDGPPRQFPAELKLQFSMKDKEMILNLTWNRHVTDDVPIVLGSGRGKKFMKRWKSKGKKSFGVYIDPVTKASIIIKNNRRHKDVLDYAGSFYDGSHEYVMEPMNWDIGAEAIHQGDIDTNMHMVYQNKPKPIAEGYETDERASAPPTEYMTEENLWATRGEAVPQSITGQPKYGVQSLVVVDYALYERWLMASSKESPEERVDDAIENIRFYFAHVMNGVDMRYRSIEDPDLQTYVGLAGFYIATTRAGAPFTQDYLTPGMPHGDVDSYAAIEGLIDWLQLNRVDLPSHDQATLYTSDYLISPYSGNRILGLGKISALCTPYAVTLNRDQGIYSSIQTGAHEMGHNYAALHDGSDNACNTNDQYIMATNPQTLTDEVYKNAFTFSPCSIQEMKDYVQSLDRQDRNCLLDVAQPGDDDIPGILETLPGDRYTPDEQCKLIFGSDSYFCGGATEEMSICRSMECFDTELRYCRSAVEQRAASGTSCGDKEWCQEGDCIYDEKAKSGPDYCIYGDYDGPYRNGLSCAIIRNDQPWHCYNDYYLDDCCESCAQIKDDTKPGCEYGDLDETCQDINPETDCTDPTILDKCCATCTQETGVCSDGASWCSTYYTQANYCYYDNDDYCCATCKPYRTGIEGCEYGDKEGCKTFVTARECYMEEETCCETCKGLVVSQDENCRYGDKEDYCIDISAHECYTEAETCCYKCPLYFTNNPGCEYGDHVTGCSLTDCEDPARSADCCNTCADYTSQPTTPDPSCVDDATWCADLDPSFCYGVEKDICCKRCAAHNTGLADCEYGDHHSWCDEIYCQSPSLKKDCCITCNEVNPLTTTTTTSAPISTTTKSSTTARSTTTTTRSTTTTTTRPFEVCQQNDASWCSDSEVRQWPTDCLFYSNDGECCNLCQQLHSGDPDCPYGDEASWCQSYATSASRCTSSSNTLESCCKTCKQFQ